MDEYHGGFYARSPRENPVAGGVIVSVDDNFTNVKSLRVLRGGGWGSFQGLLRVAERSDDGAPVLTGSRVGFRCVGSVAP